MSGPRRYQPQIAETRLRDRLTQPILDFAAKEATSGMILVALSVVAMLWANLGPAGQYEAFWQTKLGITLGGAKEAHSLRHWINDGLMVLFFLLMGLEIKREFLLGELSDRRKAALPIVAAFGGMVVPAGLYAALNLGNGNMRGTGIPMATDIAFSLGVLALLGSRAPVALKIFLTAIAIVDDLGAVLVIAIFYSGGLNLTMVGAMAVTFGLLLTLNALSVRNLLAYMGIGVLLWMFTFWSGIHATVAGVLIALTLPMRLEIDPGDYLAKSREALDVFQSDTPEDPSLMTDTRQCAVAEIERMSEHVQMPLERLENMLSPWVTYFVVPVFALANAGVALASGASALGAPVSLGILAGLILGKPIGVFLFARLAVSVRVADLPAGTSWRQTFGVAVLCGIGFTMSLFIAELAFGKSAELEHAKFAILAASALMGVVGYFTLRTACASPPRPEDLSPDLSAMRG
ncbi:MAG: Na+/H+ antiporter NhaA [Fimbriimonadaceae bacterium]|nr:Na+/H+ antiporter NhaA [Fimbriimonadaceae bacterium]